MLVLLALLILQCLMPLSLCVGALWMAASVLMGAALCWLCLVLALYAFSYCVSVIYR